MLRAKSNCFWKVLVFGPLIYSSLAFTFIPCFGTQETHNERKTFLSELRRSSRWLTPLLVLQRTVSCCLFPLQIFQKVHKHVTLTRATPSFSAPGENQMLMGSASIEWNAQEQLASCCVVKNKITPATVTPHNSALN